MDQGLGLDSVCVTHFPAFSSGFLGSEIRVDSKSKKYTIVFLQFNDFQQLFNLE